jgi:3-methyladenine DNA glycosylase Tag
MEAPAKVKAVTNADYFDVLSRAVFQSGISWVVVRAKWPGIRAALRGLDPERLVTLSPDEIDALCTDPRLIRNRRKIEATVENARRMLELADQHAGFGEYLRSHGGFEETVADLRRHFKFLGDFGAYYFLYVVDESVPDYEVWCASRGRRPAA